MTTLRAVRAWRPCCAGLAAWLSFNAGAQPAPPLQLGLPHALPAFVATTPNVPLNGELPRITVVEVPDTTIGIGPRRPHHAISIRAETPQRMLRSMGFDTADCAARFRLPSRLKANAVNGGTSVVIEAQVGLACRF
jgi:hypothetical protein